MKVKQIICTVCILALAIPMVASAEIYKWKDKDGVMRYSDTPPPGRANVDTLGKTGAAKKAQPVVTEATEASEAAPKATSEGEVPTKFKEPAFDKKVDAEAEAERIRAQNAEAEKKNKLEKEKQAEINAENCKAARANYQSYAQGGRIYKMNEKGEREYMDDAGLKAGKAQAQAEINKYCK